MENDTNSVICGIVGLFLFGVVFGPLAIYYAKGNTKSAKGKVGMALGIIDLIAFAVTLHTLL